MKTKLCVLLILICLSAFLFSNCYTTHTREAAKISKKKEGRPGIAPLADLGVLPSFNG